MLLNMRWECLHSRGGLFEVGVEAVERTSGAYSDEVSLDTRRIRLLQLVPHKNGTVPAAME